jgi:hypothetical protein
VWNFLGIVGLSRIFGATGTVLWLTKNTKSRQLGQMDLDEVSLLKDSGIRHGSKQSLKTTYYYILLLDDYNQYHNKIIILHRYLVLCNSRYYIKYITHIHTYIYISWYIIYIYHYIIIDDNWYLIVNSETNRCSYPLLKDGNRQLPFRYRCFPHVPNHVWLPEGINSFSFCELVVSHYIVFTYIYVHPIF